MAKAKTQIKSIADLKPWKANPRAISDKALTGLVSSIAEFGDLSGITFNVRNGSLVCGHQRLRAIQAKFDGKTKVRDNVVVTPDGEFPIRLVDWDEAKHAAANVVANSQFVSGEYTPDLAPILDKLKIEVPEKFEALNFGDLRKEYREFWKKEVIEDEVPPIPKKARTKTGDLYELGRHRLLCGDSTKAEDVGKVMQGAKAMLFCTDPPYGVNYGDLKESSDKRSGDLGRTRNWHRIENDDLEGEDTQKFLERTFLAWLPFIDNNAAWYLWHAQKVQGYFTAAAAAAGIIYHRQIVWVKPGLILGRGHFHWRHELCLYGWRKGHECRMPADRSENTVWEFPTDNHAAYEHPTQKPVQCFARPMQCSTEAGDICAEPFSGSGTQFIAGEQLGRIIYGMEIVPEYCDVTVSRWCKLTGKNKVILNGKETRWQPATEA